MADVQTVSVVIAAIGVRARANKPQLSALNLFPFFFLWFEVLKSQTGVLLSYW